MSTCRPHEQRSLLLCTLVAGLFFLSIAGCAPSQEAEGGLRRTGLAINLSVDSQSDTTAIRFLLERKSCSGEPILPFTRSIDKSLEDIRLPGGIPDFQDHPLDGQSSHTFADFFVDLAPGCYDVTTQPLRGDGTASLKCGAASSRNVRIQDGQTTEVFLINQCQGDGRGAIDVISALNHPPDLSALTFQRSRFVLRCEEQVVCATAKDPDNDPLEFVWRKVGGPALTLGPTVVSTTANPDGSSTQCVRAVADQVGQYQLSVAVYDLMHDPQGGSLMRFEDYLTRLGTPRASRVELTFSFYAASNGSTQACSLNSCTIGGVVYAADATNPNAACEQCKPLVSMTSWTLKAAGTQCRAATGECDVAESCTGSSASCPGDAKKPDNTACTTDSNACTADVCTSGACAHSPLPAGTSCGSGLQCNGSGTCGQVTPQPQSCSSTCDCPLKYYCSNGGTCQLGAVFGPATSPACYSDCQCGTNEYCDFQSGSYGACAPIGLSVRAMDGSSCANAGVAHPSPSYLVRLTVTGRPGAAVRAFNRHVSCSGAIEWEDTTMRGQTIPANGQLVLDYPHSTPFTCSGAGIAQIGRWEQYVTVGDRRSPTVTGTTYNSACDSAFNTCGAASFYCPPNGACNGLGCQ